MVTRKSVYFYSLLLFSLGIGVLVDYLFYGKALGVSFFVFTTMLFLGILLAASLFGKKLALTQWFLLAAALVLALFVMIRANGILTFFNVVGAFYIGIVCFALFFESPLSGFSFSKYLLAPANSFAKSFGGASHFLEEMLTPIKWGRPFGSQNTQSIAKGTLIAFPFLVLFGLLFYSADLVIQSFVNRFFDIDLDPAFLVHSLIVLVVSYLAIGVFSQIADSERQLLEKEKEPKRLFGFVESLTVLTLIIALFAGFVFVQFFYLFGGESYVWGIPEYVTYADYARRGFGELIGVAGLTFLLLYGIDRLRKRDHIKQEKMLSGVMLLLVAETAIIMISAWQRLSLYTDGYGFTFSRILGFWFLLWIFVVFGLFVWKLLRQKEESFFLVSLFWCTILFWIGLNAMNPDAFIAKKNLERYVQGKTVDTFYLGALSADAMPEVVRIFQLKEGRDIEQIKEMIAMQIYWQYPQEEQAKNQKWQSFHIGREQALESLKKNNDEIEYYQEKIWQREKACNDDPENCESLLLQF